MRSMQNARNYFAEWVKDNMQQYIGALIGEQIDRGYSLKKLIKHPLKYPELGRLAQTCEAIIDRNIEYLNFLLRELESTDEEGLRQIFRGLRSSIREIEAVERYGINVLYAPTQEIGYLNKLIYKIHQEINLPLTPPSAACIATGYYSYYGLTNIILVPVGETDFLLHTPDFFHEIGHAVISKLNEAKLRELQEAFDKIIELIANHYHELYLRKKRETCPPEIPMLIMHIHSQWKNWIEEFFCDLFALYTLGPAYAWSHLHLTVKSSENVYRFSKYASSTHPSDDARMKILHMGLQLLGFKEESKAIMAQWSKLPTVLMAKPVPEYLYAYPEELMKDIASLILKGMQDSNFTILTLQKLKTAKEEDIVKILNEVWNLFWQNPGSFRKWEEENIQKLKASLGLVEVEERLLSR